MYHHFPLCPEPRLEAAILDASNPPKIHAVTEKYVTSKGELCRSFCFQIGEGCVSQPFLYSIHASFSYHALVFLIFKNFHNVSSLFIIVQISRFASF